MIRVENLGKLYHIGAVEDRHRTLVESVTESVKTTLRRLADPRLARTGAKNIEELWALKNVSFELKRGEVLGIIGRNGSGKSTLLKILSHITAPTEGRVELYGRVGSLLEVGIGFHPELTGRENIYLSGAILGMKKADLERIFDEIVAFSEVERFINTPVKYYSSGMYVRLAFAIAAHFNPEILILDEVLAVGDAAFQRKCLGKMGSFAQEGRTVLFVSHNMASIRKLCSKAILISQGQIIGQGAIDQLVDQYLLDGLSEFTPSVSLARNSNDIGIGLEIKFFSRERVPKAQFKLYEPWFIYLEFELYKPVPHMIAGIGMSTVDSIPLATYWSKPRNLPAGKYKIEFKVDLPLKACELQFTVGLSSHERTFYYQERVGLVSISEIATGEQPIRSVGAGILLTPQAEDIEPLD